ncbi:MAG: hypothetical protein SVU32_01265, partial [Candidatus Nanohaloarchaea archaeon]|nr:hypothetical protein [Candidatus Nanohaloarchaea archaeon]
MHLRQGQFSTYLKPLLIVIFAVLLLFVVQNILGFQTNVRQQESRANFFQQIRTDYQKLINCLSVNDTLAGNNILLNQSKLITYEKQYRRREPPCAEDFQYGYNVTVTQNFLQGIRREISGGKVDLVFVMDTSGSMSDDWTDLCNVKDNVINALEDQGKDVKFTV